MNNRHFKMNGSQVFPAHPDCANNNGGASPGNKLSRIPQPQTRAPPPAPPSREPSREDMGGGAHAERWRARYQEADRKFKSLLVKSEKGQRAQNELERRLQLVEERNAGLESALTEKEAKLAKLSAVSERVYTEYGQLRIQYDVETQAMHKAMQSAGQWYQQNRRLKRRSAALLQRLPPQALQDLETQDATDAASESSGGEELEGLRETVAELSGEVARLQTEISSVKLQEFEATELNVNLTQELEQERESRQEQEERLKEALEEAERHKRLARHLASEASTFRDQLEQCKNQANVILCEAESAKKERDVLVHRSSVYLEAPSEESGAAQLLAQASLLQELETLRAELERERLSHAKEMDDLHEKLIDRETENEIFILQEKLNLAEDDIKKANERAEKAEEKLEELRGRNLNNRRSVLSRVSMYEDIQKIGFTEEKIAQVNQEKLSSGDSFVSPPPPPPPIPPPPPPPPFLPANGKPDSAKKTNSSAIADMANLLGLKQASTEKKRPSGGAIDEIINQIKGGRFHLKSTEQKSAPKKPREEPAALKEMLNILGTLRRRPKSSKESKDTTDKGK